MLCGWRKGGQKTRGGKRKTKQEEAVKAQSTGNEVLNSSEERFRVRVTSVGNTNI